MTGPGGLRRVLVANRGEIACRIIRSVHELGLEAVAVHSDADRGAAHVRQADAAVRLGPGPADESYLRADLVVAAALDTGADAVHPGYGFLSERASFAAAVEEAGLAFVGPTPGQLRDFGVKHVARRLARAAGVALLPGTDPLGSVSEALAAAAEVGYPVMLKSSAGGGGIGMRACAGPDQLAEAFEQVTRQASANFGSGEVFLERFLARARHVEVQVFGDGSGGVVVLGDRDCSVQRRNQKVIEEAPAPGLSPTTRAALARDARALAESVRYRSAGTVEFVVDADTGSHHFLEVNTRLQVEHGVTELLHDVDLVAAMLRLAGGDPSVLPELDAAVGVGADVGVGGHAVEARVYAEEPVRGFQPSPGRLTRVVLPEGVRCDGWVASGTEVTPFYDPLLVKLLARGADRDEAVARLDAALAELRLDGIGTNVEHLRAVLADERFAAGDVTTGLLATVPFAPSAIEVLDGGGQTTVTSYPGRTGYWAVGVPPSGPMDDRSFRLGNRLLGNPVDAAGLECAVTGPTLRFHRAATICVTGADMQATVEGEPLAPWTAATVPADGVLRMGAVAGPGARAYVLVAGGLDVPEVLGSRTTFVLGRFGGHAGRPLAPGDLLPLFAPAGDMSDAAPAVDRMVPAVGRTGAPAADGADGVPPGVHPPGASSAAPTTAAVPAVPPGAPAGHAVPVEERPVLGERWELAVIPGPHAAPDYLTEGDVELLYGTDWEVHYNSARTGVRLVGPRLAWARPDGGEAGLHPSNLHDNAYAVGSVDFTGDMPVILGPDGPSLGGFVCPATVIDADLWKLGQLRAGDKVRLVAVTPTTAAELRATHEAAVASPAAPRPARSARPMAARPQVPTVDPVRTRSGAATTGWPGTAGDGAPSPSTDTVLARTEADAGRPELTFRRSGDRHLLVEVGPAVLDLDLRVRVHQLAEWLGGQRIDGVTDLTPGIRSLQVQVDGDRLTVERAVELVRAADAELPAVDDAVLPSRVVHLPLSWNDPQVQKAIDIYMRSVRPDAPWCPSNLEFIRRINGLASIDEIRRIAYSAEYVVYGLGDVYLGAPVATPLDPRHRLVTTKYNPARTWTPENAVGIGGAYLCVYGMEGPGGYQFIGRTTQVWQRWPLEGEEPWLLRFFDRIRFHPVDADELLELRADSAAGLWRPEIEDGTLSMADHHRFLADIVPEADAARARQRAAFDAERADWEARGELAAASAAEVSLVAAPGAATRPGLDGPEIDVEIPDGALVVTAPLAARVWAVPVAEGDKVGADDVLVVLEAMKTETALRAPEAGEVLRLLCEPGQLVTPGRILALVTPNGGTQ